MGDMADLDLLQPSSAEEQMMDEADAAQEKAEADLWRSIRRLERLDRGDDVFSVMGDIVTALSALAFLSGALEPEGYPFR